MTYEEWAKDKQMTVREEGCARMAWDAALDAVSRYAGTSLRLHDVNALRAFTPKGKEK